MNSAQSLALPGMNFDQILALCGDFGRYQIIILGLFGYSNFLAAIHYFSQSVATFVPDHWCYHEKLANMSYEEIEKIYSQFENPYCTKLKDVYDSRNVTVSNERCARWIYNYDFGFKSMNTELNWVCHEEYHSSIGQSFFFVGSVVGTMIYGYLADIIGRLPALVISNLCGFCGDFLTMYSRQTWSFSVCRFISGLTCDTNVYLMQVIVIEYLSPKWRTVGLNLMIGVFFCAGVVCTPWIAVWAGDWKTFYNWTSYPPITVLLYYCVVQESALWLLTRNNIEGAIKRLRAVARVNRRDVSDEDFAEFRRNFEARKLQVKKKENFFDLFRVPRMRRIASILIFESIVICLTYDAVSRNVEDIGISATLTFCFTGLIIFPGSLVVCCLQDRIGRKGIASTSMFFAAVTTTITGIILAYKRERSPVMHLILILLARIGASISFDSGQQFAAEVVPSSVRGQSMAVIHVAGYAASISVPFIVLLGKYFKAAPSLILGVLNIIGSFLCLFLPETTDKILPKTIEEAEEFGKDDTLCYFVCCQSKSAAKEP